MRHDYPEPMELEVLGFQVTLDDHLGHLIVAHDGTLTWDQLQAIKCEVWGDNARAIEVYPAAADVVNNGQYRHLWRLAADDFCPDLLGHVTPRQTLERRFHKAWDAAHG